MNIRIIPRLDIKGSNLVKGIHLEGLRVLGKPEHFSRYYYENGADELIYIDIVASLYERNSLLHIIEETAREIFIIEAKKRPDDTYECYTDNGRVRTGVKAIDWARRAVELGAGEILLTSIDQEGTGKGYDLELTQQVAQAVSIPVIACGGAGSVADVYETISKSKADAVSIASILHYQFIEELKHRPDLFTEGNTNFLFSGQNYSKVEKATIGEIKEYLTERSISCRSH